MNKDISIWNKGFNVLVSFSCGYLWVLGGNSYWEGYVVAYIIFLLSVVASRQNKQMNLYE